jgi:hypothetical protein
VAISGLAVIVGDDPSYVDAQAYVFTKTASWKLTAVLDGSNAVVSNSDTGTG